MTETEQRIALCEWMGWKNCGKHPFTDSVVGFPPEAGPEIDDWDILPNTNSLDVLHAMVDRLDYEDYQLFCLNLGMICREQNTKNFIVPAERFAINATAAQRREALLKTFDKWPIKVKA